MPRIPRLLGLLAGFAFIAIVTTIGILGHEEALTHAQLSFNRLSLTWSSTFSSDIVSDHLGLGFIFRTYVVSLPHRNDRQADIETLMSKLDMPNWHYHNGTYANNTIVGNFMRNVQAQRVDAEDDPSEWVVLPFKWPRETLSNYTSSTPLIAQPLPLAGVELWPEDTLHAKDELDPMMGAFDNFKLEKWKPASETTPGWRHLTPERVGTYHAHMTAVRRIVDDNARLRVDVSQHPNRTQTHVSLILEDDIDIEVDAQKRLEVILPLLPFNWDILFLGYCWSEEDKYPAITGEYIRPSKNQLHPSFMPRCLHAYALSPAGALRVLTHLRHEQYGYGRAVDEAFSWLISSKRVTSLTTVPPLIIQRKVTKTDISLEGNDLWRESLDQGVLGTTMNGEEV